MFDTIKQQIKKRMLGDNGGFTLLEAVVAMLVFTVGILATTTMQQSALNGGKNAQQITEACNLAADQLETLRPLDYLEDAALDPGAYTFPPAVTGTDYTLTYTVQEDAIIDNTKWIHINVQWMEGDFQRTMDLDCIKPDII